MALFIDSTYSIYADCITKVITIAIDAKTYRDRLINNIHFMHLITHDLISKLQISFTMNAADSTLSDRVRNYMRYKCENGTLKGIEKAAFRLHCSSRQLQRILKAFEAEGIVEKIGKGAYRLKNVQPNP